MLLTLVYTAVQFIEFLCCGCFTVETQSLKNRINGYKINNHINKYRQNVSYNHEIINIFLVMSAAVCQSNTVIQTTHVDYLNVMS